MEVPAGFQLGSGQERDAQDRSVGGAVLRIMEGLFFNTMT